MRVFASASLISSLACLTLAAAGQETSAVLPPLPSTTATPDAAHAVSVSRNAANETGFGFTHADNWRYTATIHVNGVPYQVHLDTGSSDTWIDPWSQGVAEPPGVFYTGINSTSTYVDTTVASGPIVLANVTFGEYTVMNQAITLAYNGSVEPGSYNGLIGLAGIAKSQVFAQLLNTSWARNGMPILYNLFEHEPDLPNYTTMLMSRSEIGIADGGVLTVSEVLSNMTDILDAPLFQSPITSAWTTVMDGLYVNGELLTGHSNFSDVFRPHISIPEGGTIATFDTGTSYILGPEYYAHAVYKDLPGASLVDPSLDLFPPGFVAYQVPCNTKLNLTFSFQGHLYPVHPTDAIDIATLPNGTFVCIGTISGGHSAMEDWLIGDSFLRNTYQLYDYGDLSSLLAPPSARLLSITDPNKAWAETDAMNLARIIAFQDRYLATVAVTTTATDRLAYTGSVPAATLTSASDELPPRTTSSATPTTPSSATDRLPQAPGGDADTRVAGAISEDDVPPSSVVDLSALTRNSYVILGLLAGALVLLLAIAALVVSANREDKGYRSVPSANLARGTRKAVFEIDAEPLYSTPYDSRE